jgi:phospholipid/cholesterol/gamma-HCH transport system substrate-binding protein
MDEQKLRFRVGVVVLAAAMITGILIALLGAWPNPFRRRYTVHVEFPRAPGVTVDTPIRKSGIEIGRVSDVELLDNGQVLVSQKIYSDYRLTTNEVCRISTGSLVTGDAILEWVRIQDIPPGETELIESQDYLTNGQVAADPFKTLTNLEEQIQVALTSIRNSGQSVASAGTEVEQVAQKLNRILGAKEPELEDLVDEALLTLRNFNKIMADLQEITGDEQLREKLRGALDRLPDLFADAQQTLTQVRSTLDDFKAAAVRAERNLAYLEDFTYPLGQRGEEISQNLVQSIRSINRLVSNLAELAQALNQNEGTIGQLINNPELYERVNRTVMEIETLVRQVEPILNDFRVISDKLARDPRQLGVKGILDRRPVGAGQKFPTGHQPARPSYWLHRR